MSWHVLRIFRVAALCALFLLHVVLVGITAAGMLGSGVGDFEALQFSMDIVALFTILCFCVLRYKCRDAVSSRLANFIVFSLLLALSLVGAIGLAARAASINGKGLCQEISSKHFGNCTQAAFALAFAWLAVAIAIAGIVISWLDRGSRTSSLGNPEDWREPTNEIKKFKSTFRSSHSYVPGPTSSYVPRPRDPYDTPRRKRSTRSAQSHQTGPQRAPSHKGPVLPLPALPAFNALGLEPDTTVDRRVGRRQTRRPRSEQSEQKGLPELPPPTRRPTEDPHKREIQKVKRISPTDLFAEMG